MQKELTIFVAPKTENGSTWTMHSNGMRFTHARGSKKKPHIRLFCPHQSPPLL